MTGLSGGESGHIDTLSRFATIPECHGIAVAFMNEFGQAIKNHRSLLCGPPQGAALSVARRPSVRPFVPVPRIFSKENRRNIQVNANHSAGKE